MVPESFRRQEMLKRIQCLLAGAVTLAILTPAVARCAAFVVEAQLKNICWQGDIWRLMNLKFPIQSAQEKPGQASEAENYSPRHLLVRQPGRDGQANSVRAIAHDPAADQKTWQGISFQSTAQRDSSPWRRRRPSPARAS